MPPPPLLLLLVASLQLARARVPDFGQATTTARHAGLSLHEPADPTESCHAALNLPWHFLIDFL